MESAILTTIILVFGITLFVIAWKQDTNEKLAHNK
jgi:hypothetical protein